MKYQKLIYGFAAITLLFASCEKDVLDRPPLTRIVDADFWRNEADLRLFGNGFYTNYFNGYNTGFTVDYTPVRGYTFSDDLTGKNAQPNFENSVPSSRASTSEGAAWLGAAFGGPTWDFAWVRKANLFLNRIETRTKPSLSEEAYKHWTAVGRFFRAFEYSRLVSVFGDVPYFDQDLGPDDLTILYKDRDPRGVVMDKVYDDLKYVMANMRDNDGAQNLNRYIAAAFISRFMLFEGTYEHYHGIDAARAKKYLEFARDAAQFVMTNQPGKYDFSSDFKSLFSSESLAGNKEVIMYRAYDAALSVTHSITSYQNGTEVVNYDANLQFVKSFIVNDGKVWQEAHDPLLTPAITSFKIADLTQTRDPRFEASFMSVANNNATTLLYGYKFAPRDALNYIGKPYPPAYGSSTNTADAPVIRYAEVVLNWIEAKAVLAEYFGGAAVTQADIDKSINAIRDRPLDATAISKGIKKTKHLDLVLNFPVDPVRDADVPPLIWEIRRERRMEFVFEFSRIMDLKRWKKLNYMNFSTNPDYLLGPWVDVLAEMPSVLTSAAATAKNVKVRKMDGTVVTYDGSNAASMVGFWMVTNASNRAAFTDRSYLAPVGLAQITGYAEKGFKLTQTVGWQ